MGRAMDDICRRYLAHIPVAMGCPVRSAKLVDIGDWAVFRQMQAAKCTVESRLRAVKGCMQVMPGCFDSGFDLDLLTVLRVLEYYLLSSHIISSAGI